MLHFSEIKILFTSRVYRSLSSTHSLAEICFRVLAEFTVAALKLYAQNHNNKRKAWSWTNLGCIQRNNNITRFDVINSFADRFNDSGTFMSENNRKQTFGIVPTKSIGISVANTGEINLKAIFAKVWRQTIPSFELLQLLVDQLLYPRLSVGPKLCVENRNLLWNLPLLPMQQLPCRL